MDAESHRAKRRDAIVESALVVLAERGLAETRLEDVARHVGISTGHILYYFDSKADLFLQTLRAIEDDFQEGARRTFETMPLAADRWSWLLETALPDGRGDVRLLLWLEAWERAPRDERFIEVLREVESRWMDLLRGVLYYGEVTGELDAPDIKRFATWFSALMDGLTIQVVTGSSSLDRERMLEICFQVSNAELRWNSDPPRPRGPEHSFGLGGWLTRVEGA